MILSNTSIKRPVLATILSASLVVFGLFSLPDIPVELYPNVDFPVVSVQVVWPGAAPESVEAQILEPLVCAVYGFSGLDKLRSTAYPNLGLLVLQFKLEKNSQQASQETRDKIFSSLGDLPPDIETPIIERFEIGGAPIINIAVSSKSLELGKLSKISDDMIRTRLQRLDGVGKVELTGDRQREMHVLINRAQLSTYKLSAEDVVQSIKAQNLDVPAGKIENLDTYYPLRVQKPIKSTADLSSLPILSSSGTRARISDVAKVLDTIAEEKTLAFRNEERTILLSVFKQSGANTTAIAENILKTVEKLKKEQPEVSLDIVTDDSKYVQAAVDGVKLDLFFGALLAILVVLLFLRDKRATFISALALPTAIIGTFSFLRFMGFTLNMMSMLGLSLSIGILIDDAIVVIENIYRHLQMGKNPKEAAKDATSEIGLAVLATTATIVAVFVPVAFMDGIIGRFFYQFGLTVAFAVSLSTFVALTLTPMLSSRLLKNEDQDNQENFLSRLFDQIDSYYERILAWTLQNRIKTVLMGVGTFVFSLFLLGLLPMSFFPKEDRSQFAIDFTLPENTNLEPTKKQALAIARFVKQYPGVHSVISKIGSGTEKKPNQASLIVLLVPKEDRTYSQQDLMQRIRKDLQPFFPDPKSEFSVVTTDNEGGGASQPIQLVFLSDDRDSLTQFTNQVMTFLKEKVEGTADITSTEARPQVEYNLDLGLLRALDLSINPASIASNARTLFEGEKVGQFIDQDDRYDIRVKLSKLDRSKPDDIGAITTLTPLGSQQLFSSIASIQPGIAPAKIERLNGQQQITVLSNYTKSSLSAAIDQIQTYVTKNKPEQVSLNLEGEAEIIQKSVASMLQALLLAVILIYLILCAQYERYLAPFVIMMSLPLSFTGAFGALLLFNEFISVYTMIGLILLMGIVTKNGILLIDFTLQKMRDGLSVHDALMQAGPVRLRPILMTTFAAGFGMLPVAIGHGEGGEAKASMGIAVIGGLLASTFLTLVVIPCVFSLMEQFRPGSKV